MLMVFIAFGPILGN